MKKIQSVMYTSDRVVNKKKPKGRGSDFFFVGLLVDDAGVLTDDQGNLLGKGAEYHIYFPLSRLREAVSRANSNTEDTMEVTFTASKWWKPRTWSFFNKQ
jgi:hypothetical protein